ncbi:CAF17-like 4Fe-4S cluster assembly/insertion protein YgfZ [Nakamurella leprariae]|uniref:Folate-binding protein YgfZ n=1 Tax=Nakamurella leprariae TaxID=2803911 RepID=A0A939C107_9ACTN|nr:folate-binding protein YgfZ [Nakamurella leprariae]MBM9466614.1 folate-binding protein YgfZ [Nakamurella leprariae]
MSDAVEDPARRSPLLQLPGAVAATGPDAGVAWHYGDPLAEQRAAERSAVLLDRSHRGRLVVTGEDRNSWLHTVTSQHLAGLTDGTATEALVLSPNGHVEHHFGVTAVDGVVHLDTEASVTAALLTYLDRMRFWSKVEIADATGTQALLTVAGPQADAVLRAALDVASLPGNGAATVIEGGWIRRADLGTLPGWDVSVPADRLGTVASALLAAGARAAGSWAAEALRVTTRRPRLGLDVDDRTIPNEVAWLDTAVHLDKGCYRGQETVARVHNLGRPPRRLVLLNLDGSQDRLPEPGDAVTTAAGRTVGRVGTVVQHHEDGPVALALVRRGVEPGTPLLAGGVDAMIDPADAAGSTVERGADRIDRQGFREVRRS